MDLRCEKVDLSRSGGASPEQKPRRLAAPRNVSAERLAYPEAEAAMLLGVARHVLRDARLRGEIKATRIGKRIVYARDELLRFLARRR